MLKKRKKIWKYLYFTNATKFKLQSKITQLKTLFSNTFTKKCNPQLYKKLAFIGLSLGVLSYNRFHSERIKSLFYVGWESVSTYTFVF